jgi:hypothetical protein
MPLIFCLLQVQTQTTQSQSDKHEDAQTAHNLSRELSSNFYKLHATTSTSSIAIADDSTTPTTTSTIILLGASPFETVASPVETAASPPLEAFIYSCGIDLPRLSPREIVHVPE